MPVGEPQSYRSTEAAHDQPGTHVVREAVAVTEKHVTASTAANELKPSTGVDVIEFVTIPGEECVRAKVRKPEGWIALTKLEDDGHDSAEGIEEGEVDAGNVDNSAGGATEDAQAHATVACVQSQQLLVDEQLVADSSQVAIPDAQEIAAVQPTAVQVEAGEAVALLESQLIVEKEEISISPRAAGVALHELLALPESVVQPALVADEAGDAAALVESRLVVEREETSISPRAAVVALHEPAALPESVVQHALIADEAMVTVKTSGPNTLNDALPENDAAVEDDYEDDFYEDEFDDENSDDEGAKSGTRTSGMGTCNSSILAKGAKSGTFTSGMDTCNSSILAKGAKSGLVSSAIDTSVAEDTEVVPPRGLECGHASDSEDGRSQHSNSSRGSRRSRSGSSGSSRRSRRSGLSRSSRSSRHSGSSRSTRGSRKVAASPRGSDGGNASESEQENSVDIPCSPAHSAVSVHDSTDGSDA
jgi:hypothetical protein